MITLRAEGRMGREHPAAFSFCACLISHLFSLVSRIQMSETYLHTISSSSHPNAAAAQAMADSRVGLVTFIR